MSCGQGNFNVNERISMGSRLPCGFGTNQGLTANLAVIYWAANPALCSNW
jgi:hypothetical protein